LANLSGLELAAWHARRGDLKAASEILDKLTGARGEILRATILRRRRDAAGALAALARARQDEPALAGDLAVAEAALLMRLDRTTEASAALARAPDGPGVAAAAFLRGGLLLDSDPGAAKQTWTQLVQAHPESRYAWIAAAYLGVGSIYKGGATHHGWPAADVLATLEHPKAEMLPPSAVDRAEHTALAFLLSAQRRDGSWICP